MVLDKPVLVVVVLDRRRKPTNFLQNHGAAANFPVRNRLFIGKCICSKRWHGRQNAWGFMRRKKVDEALQQAGSHKRGQDESRTPLT